MRKVYHKIIQIAGNVITVEADNVGYNDLAEVTSARGTSLAQVIRLQDDKVFLQLPLKTEAKVVISGIYITEIKSVRGGLQPLPEKKGFFSRFRKNKK